jgi:predicted secreted protein
MNGLALTMVLLMAPYPVVETSISLKQLEGDNVKKEYTIFTNTITIKSDEQLYIKLERSAGAGYKWECNPSWLITEQARLIPNANNPIQTNEIQLFVFKREKVSKNILRFEYIGPNHLPKIIYLLTVEVK